MTRRPTYYGSEGHHVEAAIVAEDGKLTFTAINTRLHGSKTGPKVEGIAYCDLWAHVEPTTNEPGDFVIKEVYASSHFTPEVQQLTGDIEVEAKKVLLADEEWREWAASDVENRSGYRPAREPYHEAGRTL